MRITKQILLRFLAGNQYCDLEKTIERQVGNTTVKALEILATSIKQPGKVIPIIDHINKKNQNIHLMDIIIQIIDCLALDNINIDSTNLTITCYHSIELTEGDCELIQNTSTDLTKILKKVLNSVN